MVTMLAPLTVRSRNRPLRSKNIPKIFVKTLGYVADILYICDIVFNL